MNDYRVTLNRRQEQFLSRMLPKGYSFQLYKVRKNINDYPYREFDKKYKKTESIILSKKESQMYDSFQPSEVSWREKSQQPAIQVQPLKPMQEQLLTMVRKLKKHESSYPFRSPVDPKALQVPDYFDIVLEPMDLKTIQEKIRNDVYSHSSEFQRDMYKMLMNSYKYNQKSTTTYFKTVQFQEYYLSVMKEYCKIKQQEGGKGQEGKIKKEQIEQKQYAFDMDEELFDVLSNKGNNIEIRNERNNQIASKEDPSSKEDNQLIKVLTEMIQPKPKAPKKSVPKPLSSSQALPKPPVSFQNLQSLQQPNPKIQVENLPNQNNISIQPKLQQSLMKQSEEQMKEEIKQLIQNQTQNHRQQRQRQLLQLSQPFYNESAHGTCSKIPNLQVQKEISYLLKRLSQFPLTKHKKQKIMSKLHNLDQPMTQSDKKKLFEKILKLDQSDLQFVVKILTKNNKHQVAKHDEFQIDLDRTDHKVLREVQNFLLLKQNPLLANPQITNDQSSFLNSAPVTPIPTTTTPSIFPANFTAAFPQSSTPAIYPVQSSEQVSISKKTKKQQKKLKKKPTRKNSNDDSFSLNPPPSRKKKSEKPHQQKEKKKHQKLSSSKLYEMSEPLPNSADEIQKQDHESSSYHPEPQHHSHNGNNKVQQKVGNVNIHITEPVNKATENKRGKGMTGRHPLPGKKQSQIVRQQQNPQSNNYNSQKNTIQSQYHQNNQQSSQYQSTQYWPSMYQSNNPIHMSPYNGHNSNPYNQNANHYSYNNQNVYQPAQDQQKICDISQFLYSSKHINNEDSSPFEHYEPFSTSKLPKHSIDFMEENHFPFIKSHHDRLQQEEIRQYSLEQQQNHNEHDVDHFLG